MRDDLREKYKNVFDSNEGKIVLADLLNKCHVTHSSYVSGDSHATAFQEGERNVALIILDALHTGPDNFDEVVMGILNAA